MVKQKSNKEKAQKFTLTFVDSYNHIIAPLAAIPEMYSIEGVSKSWCPYDFLDHKTIHYKGGFVVN